MSEREGGDAPENGGSSGGGLGRKTVVFAALTGLSRVAGLAREVVAARYFGVSGAMSAFTIAFQVPNLMRALFADQALQGAFVPVFTEMLEKGRRREAFRLATTFAFLIVAVLATLSALFVLAAPLIAPALTPGFSDDQELRDLTTNLARLMFPTIVLFSLSGLMAGMLNALDHFSSPVAAQVLWNVAIVVAILVLVPVLPKDDEIYAYAIGVVAATAVQLAYPLPWLRRHGPLLSFPLLRRSPEVRKVLRLMLPVTLTLGLFNFALLINSLIATLVSEEGPAAIDRAFRIVVLPQGVFSLAIATVLFPTMARLAARGEMDDLRAVTARGVRLMTVFMLPSALVLAVLAEPVTRFLYERGEFSAGDTALVADALAVWALTLPFQGASTFMAQAFFSLQRPWVTTGLAGSYVAVNAAIGLALHEPLGIEGVVLGTVAANVFVTVAYCVVLGRAIGGLEVPATLGATARMLLAGAVLAAVTYGVWAGADELLGRSLVAQGASLAAGALAGTLVYVAGVWLLRVDEARDVLARVLSRARP